MTDDLTKIAGVVQQAEVVGAVLVDKGISGADKLRVAIPGVAQVFLQSEVLIGKKVRDNALFLQGCSKVGDGMADIQNSLE